MAPNIYDWREFVEWLMGFPVGHTGLKRSEMPSSRKLSNS